MNETGMNRRGFLGRAALGAAGLAAARLPYPNAALAATQASDAPVTITLWGWWDIRMAIYEEAAKGFMEENPNVTVQVVTLPSGDDVLPKLYSALPSGTGPTMLKMGEFLFQLRDEELVVPFPEDLFPESWLQEAYPGFDWATYGRYVVPTGASASVFVYNTAMFQEAGLDPAAPPRTWDELIKAAKKLTQRDDSGAITRAGFVPGVDFTPLDYLYQLGGNIVTRDNGQPVATFDTPQMQQAYQFLADLELTHKVWSHDFLPSEEAIGTGRAAMTLCESYQIGDWRSSYADMMPNLAFAAPPTPTGEPEPLYGRKSIVLDVSVLTGRPPEEQAAAFRFLEYLYKKRLDIQFELVDLIALAPERKDLLDDPRVKESPWLSIMPEFTAKEHDPVQAIGELQTITEDVLTRILVTQEPVASAVSYGQEQMQQLVAKGSLNYLQ
ncbi:MAG: extracellular solute-binding protein [Chloroflexia bacterium]|nr:extracellular solute-binding protein [Chloroflexia bacterium]